MSFFSSKNTSQLQAYQPAKQGLDQNLQFLTNQPYMQAFGGPYAASMNPFMQQGIQGMAGFGAGSAMGGQFANNMYTQGQGLTNQGIGGMTDMLSRMQSNPMRFSFDNQTANQIENRLMPAAMSQASLAGLQNSAQRMTNIGQLASSAGQASGGLGSNPLSKLGQGGAAYNAAMNLGNRQIGTQLGMQVGQAGINAGMQGGLQNLNAGMQSQNAIMNGFGNLMNTGLGMQGQGYRAGIQNLGLLNQAGNTQQRFDQFGTDMARQQFMDQQQIPLADAQNRLGLFQSAGAQFGKNVSQSRQSGFNTLMGGLGAAMGIGGGLSQMGVGGLFGGNGGFFGMGGAPNVGDFGFAKSDFGPGGYMLPSPF